MLQSHTPTGSPSSKYEHRRASALLRNIQNIGICMEKKPIVYVTYEMDCNKKQLTLLKMCVTSLLCGPQVDLQPFYGFLCKLFSLHILSKVSCFLLKSFHFVGYRNDRFFSHTHPYILNVTQQCRWSPMLIFRAWATCDTP